MAEFSDMKKALANIVDAIQRAKEESSGGKTKIIRAQTILTNLPGIYQTIISDINAFLSSNPNDEAAKNLKAEKDLLVSEFTSFKSEIDDLVAAIGG